MSPGQFLSQKSGKLGYLGDVRSGEERPLWYHLYLDYWTLAWWECERMHH